MSNEQSPIAASLATDIAKHCAAFEQSPEYAEMIQTHVRKLYEKAIEDTFRWGKFPDSVKKALEEALPANISEMVDLPRYNLLMAKELAAQWELNGVSERLVTGMKDMVLDFVKSHEVPKFIKASDLWEAFVEQYQEEAAHEGWERPQVIFEDDRDGFIYVGLEKEPESESSLGFLRNNQKDRAFGCDTYLGFHQKTIRENLTYTPVLHDGHPVYSLFAGKLEHGDTLGKKPVQFRTRFEQLVGALYYGDSLLVLDSADADEIYYPSCD